MANEPSDGAPVPGEISAAGVDPAAEGGDSRPQTERSRRSRIKLNWRPPKRLYVAGVDESAPWTELTLFAAAHEEAEGRKANRGVGGGEEPGDWVSQLEQDLTEVAPAEYFKRVFEAVGKMSAAGTTDDRTAHLRGGVAIAILLRENAHLDLLNEAGQPAFPDQSCFLGWLQDELGLGSSATRLSHICRAAELWLTLRTMSLPLPKSLGRLEKFESLALEDAVDQYGKLAVAAGNAVPNDEAIAQAVAVFKADRACDWREGRAGAKGWRGEVRQKLVVLRRAVETTPGDRTGLRKQAADLMALLGEKYARADVKVVSKISLLRLRLLAKKSHGVSAQLECHPTFLLLRFEPGMAAAIKEKLRADALRRNWTTPADGLLQLALPPGSAERLAKVGAEHHWLSRLLRKLAPGESAAHQGQVGL